MSTTRVLVILSLTTTPSRVFVSATDVSLSLRGAAPLAQDGLDPREVAARLADARGILGHAHGQLEAEVEKLLGELLALLRQLVFRHLTPFRRLHGRLRAPASGTRTWS